MPNNSGDPLYAERYIIGFSYDDPPNYDVKRVLQRAALETKHMLDDPTPDVRTLSYEDFAITYEMKYYLDDYKYVATIHNEFSTRIFYAANRDGLTIALRRATIKVTSMEKR